MIAIVSSDGDGDLHDKQVFNNLLRGKVGEDWYDPNKTGRCLEAGKKCGSSAGSFGTPCCSGLSCKGFNYRKCVQMIVIVKDGVLSCLFSSLRCLAVVIWFDRRNEWQLNIKKSCCVLHYEKLLNLISRILIICPIDRDTFSFWQICHCLAMTPHPSSQLSLEAPLITSIEHNI